jgi:hypothetical protein
MLRHEPLNKILFWRSSISTNPNNSLYGGLILTPRASAATQCVDAVHNGKRTKIVHLVQYICVDPTPGLESGADQYFWTTLKLCCIVVSSSHYNKLTTTVMMMTVLEQAPSSTTAIKCTSEVQKGPQVKGVAKMNLYDTRHRGVLTLYKEVNVYDMRSGATSSTSLPDIIRSSRSATPVMHAQKIATKRLQKANGWFRDVEFGGGLHCYPGEQRSEEFRFGDDSTTFMYLLYPPTLVSQKFLCGS